MAKEIELSIVVPIYHGAKYIDNLLFEMKEAFSGVEYEIIFVYDGSPDNSWEKIESVCCENIVGIKLTRNFGQHNATLCGLRHARGKYLMTMDQDLQHHPKEALKLVSKIKERYSLVYGQYADKKHSWFRNFGSNFINFVIQKVSGNNYKITSFRVMRKEVVDNMDKFDNPKVNIDVLLSQVVSQKDIGLCTVEHYDNTIGDSTYNIFKLASFALNVVFNYTIFPLRMATYFGATVSFGSFVIAVFYFVRYLLGYTTIRGYTSTMIVLAFLMGSVLMFMGIIGEYVGRIFESVNNKPQYKVMQVKKED